MSYDPDDTICAIATATGGAARGMVRVSGPRAVDVISQMFDPLDRASLVEVRQPTAITGRVHVDLDPRRQLPCDLFLWPTARSYTRQPAAELHTLGSPPLLQALLAAVCRAGARLAEPGEFTLRAFLAGRIDLTQAEGVLGVIDARGDEELRGALAQLAGGLARPLHRLRQEMLQLLAELEAGLDFVDEDIQFISSDELRERLEMSGRMLRNVSQQIDARHASTPTTQVVLTGPPNVGKSSLFNALVATRGSSEPSSRPRPTPALVSPQRGTTRDYLTATIEIDGVRCELVDTAGLDRNGLDDAVGSRARPNYRTSTIEIAAQAHAEQRRAQAAIRACCADASQVAMPGLEISDDCHVIVLTKADIAPRATRTAAKLSASVPVIITSSRTGEGLDKLCAALRDLLTSESAAQPGKVVAATADRCRESIRLAEAALRRASKIADARHGEELLAVELRIALAELGKVVGAVYTDDLLDRIFSTFCIGK